MSVYDSRPDNQEHIETVRSYMRAVIGELRDRAERHDASKLVEPEVSVFDEYTPKLKASTYGSDEYKAFLVGMGEGLRHHYAANDHHRMAGRAWLAPGRRTQRWRARPLTGRLRVRWFVLLIGLVPRLLARRR